MSIALTLLLFILGLIFGSFLNVVIYRLPRRESVVYPPSHCPACHHRLQFLDLFPVLSYLWLRGRCRYCQTKINPRYPLVEFITGLVTVIWWFRYGINPEGIALLIATYFLIAIAYIDLSHKIIPDALSLPLLVGAVLFRLWQGEWVNALIGLLVGGGTLGLIALIYPQGMGWGDVKLLAATGALLGWEKTCYVLILGCLFGLLTVIPLIFFKKMDRKQQFPFGPFLVLAAMAIIFWLY
jgi:leader peptidase (prepilin peptidase)/N-methyltransferase